MKSLKKSKSGNPPGWFLGEFPTNFRGNSSPGGGDFPGVFGLQIGNPHPQGKNLLGKWSEFLPR